MSENRDDLFWFTNEAGKLFRIRPISLMLYNLASQGIKEEFIARGEPIEPPTYTVTLAGDNKLEYPLNETILIKEDDEEETLRRTIAWGLHQDALRRMSIEITSATMEMVKEAIDQEPDKKWEIKLKKFHVKVPEDADEKRELWLATEVLITPMDIILLQERVIYLSMSGLISKDELSAARSVFPGSLQERRKNATRKLGTPRKNSRKAAGRSLDT